MSSKECSFEHNIPTTVCEIITGQELVERRRRDKKHPKALYKLFPEVYENPTKKTAKNEHIEETKKRKKESSDEESESKKKRKSGK